MSEQLSVPTVFDGPQVTLEDMLAAREDRSRKQTELLKTYKSHSLLCATMNIPGSIKNSVLLSRAFERVIKQVKGTLAGHINFEKEIVKKTGCEYYLISDLAANDLKKSMIEIEASTPLGRLMDLDVLQLIENYPKPISRQELGFPKRRCFICQGEAKSCARSRKHNVETMQAKLAQIISENL